LWDRIKPEHFQPWIKGKELTWQQWLTFCAVKRAMTNEGKRRISIVSGHKCGKSSSMAMLIIWWLFCFKNAQIGATAPTREQIHDVLWKEIKVWLDKMPPKHRDWYDWQSGYLRMKEDPEVWFARARTARKESSEAVAGLHSEFPLIIVDEASGVDDVIFRSAEASLASPQSLIVLVGNGIRNLGYFYETHGDSKEKQRWQALSFDSTHSPLATKEWRDGIEQKYGSDSDEYRIRVLGKFPSSEQMDESGFIPLITDRDIRQVSEGIPFVGRTYLGIDPAGEGDDLCTFTLRDRFQARVVEKLSSSNDKQIAKVAYDIIQRYNLHPQDVTVFNFGIGENVSTELLLLDHLMHINTIKEGEKASDESTFLNIRMELAWRMRQWLVRGGAIVGDELKRDVTGYAYQWLKNGKRQLMAKHELKKRMGRSPDRGDSFMGTFAVDASTDIHSNEQIRQHQVTTTKNIHDAL